MKVYLDKEIKYEFIRKFNDSADMISFTEFLNKWGEKGWQLVKTCGGCPSSAIFVKRYVERKNN